MRARCIADKLSTEQKLILGVPEAQNPCYQITVGRVYTVLGISYQTQSKYCNGTMLEIQEDEKAYCISIPLCLFEVVDRRISKYWIAVQRHFDMTLWPEEFYTDFFHDDLTEGIKETKAIYEMVVEKILNEFDSD
jgi:hypothetical protein